MHYSNFKRIQRYFRTRIPEKRLCSSLDRIDNNWRPDVVLEVRCRFLLSQNCLVECLDSTVLEQCPVANFCHNWLRPAPLPPSCIVPTAAKVTQDGWRVRTLSIYASVADHRLAISTSEDGDDFIAEDRADAGCTGSAV